MLARLRQKYATWDTRPPQYSIHRNSYVYNPWSAQIPVSGVESSSSKLKELLGRAPSPALIVVQQR